MDMLRIRVGDPDGSGRPSRRYLAGDGDGEASAANATRPLYTFAVVPIMAGFDFFEDVRGGCESKARELGVECVYVGPDLPNATAQAEIIDGLASSGQYDGMAVSVTDFDLVPAAIRRAVDAGMPVVTFDSDAPASSSSGRAAHIGNNNLEFGRQLGKVLLQIDPTGGQYGVLSTPVAPHIEERDRGLRDALAKSMWREGVYADCFPCDEATSLQRLNEMMADHPNLRAVLVTIGSPMMIEREWMEFVDANRDLTLVVGDAIDPLVNLMNRGYANGLVGQMPWIMGELAMTSLLKLNLGEALESPIYTSPTQHVVVPIDLEDPVVDMNYIGDLRFLGYFLMAIVVGTSLGFAAWTYAKRAVYVIQMSQPEFLIMICLGTILMGSSIFPLTVDDERHSPRGADVACMSFPWLISVGFVTALSALFSKTWRVNKILNSPDRFRRIKVTKKDVMAPFLVLMTANLIVLTLWTVLAPLKFVRRDHEGTDEWNRVISTYGTCEPGEGARGGKLAYVLPLVAVNLSAMIKANVQAYKARKLDMEFSESRYVALSMVSILQAFVMGVPILLLLREDPRTAFVVTATIITLVCMAILCFIFVPKIYFAKVWEREQELQRVEMEQRQQRSLQFTARIEGLSGQDSTRVSGYTQGSSTRVSGYDQGSSTRVSGHDQGSSTRVSGYDQGSQGDHCAQSTQERRKSSKSSKSTGSAVTFATEEDVFNENEELKEEKLSDGE